MPRLDWAHSARKRTIPPHRRPANSKTQVLGKREGLTPLFCPFDELLDQHCLANPKLRKSAMVYVRVGPKAEQDRFDRQTIVELDLAGRSNVAKDSGCDAL